MSNSRLRVSSSWSTWSTSMPSSPWSRTNCSMYSTVRWSRLLRPQGWASTATPPAPWTRSMPSSSGVE
ncbi:Uncharacterised protein [Mycobacteroides abscessus subsp. abscessus]|nr:Uncharacterised protein [Mycobacteroides abscessus subsp. abscessus]